MISLELARRLQAAGLKWQPVSGDRFVVPDRDLDDQVFVVSEMTIEVQQVVGGTELKFNGTTEWALDSLDQAEALWLPRESQLRDALGSSFVSLRGHGGVFAVQVRPSGAELVAADAEDAYALAWLALRGGAGR